MSQHIFSISAIERETSLSKDVLRKWEARYGFPMPVRKLNGERFYTSADLDRLLIIKRLLDQGLRPAMIVPLTPEKLNSMAQEASCAAPPEERSELLDHIWIALKSHDPVALKSTLNQALIAYGLLFFVRDTMPEINRMVGSGWANGSLAIYQEHLYSEIIRNLLLEALGQVRPRNDRPTVLLSTPPGEDHDLGLLMVQSILALSGAHCISLGPKTPALELIAAAVAFKAHIVALSFSFSFPKRRILPFLQQVRSGLPEKVQLWAGGAAMDSLQRMPPGIHTFANLDLAAAALINFTIEPNS